MIPLCKTFFITLLLASFAAGPVLAVEPCLPDCPSSTWSSPLVTLLALPGGCAVKVEYRTRLACGMYNDYYVERIEPVNPNDPACKALGQLSVKEVVNMVAEILITIDFNATHSPPPGTCQTNWRVVAGCWCRKELPGGNCGATRLWGPCETSSCCLKPYTACVDPIGSISVTPQPGTSSPDCGSAVPTCGQGSTCESVCD